MLEAFDKGLLATTLRYAYEVREQGAYFEDVPELKLPAEMVQLAGHIIDTKAAHFDPKKFEDHYETARRIVEEETGGASDRACSGGRSRSSTRDQSHGRAARKHRRRDRKEAGGGQHKSSGRGWCSCQEEDRTLTYNAEPDSGRSKALSPSPAGLRR